jgi:hypothetical protein
LHTKGTPYRNVLVQSLSAKEKHMLSLDAFVPERWYCFLVVKTPVVSPSASMTETTDAQQQQQQSPTKLSLNRKRVRTNGERRTSIHYSKDPFAFIASLNRSDSSSSLPPPQDMAGACAPTTLGYIYEIVTILGQFETEEDARIVKTIWNYKSRAVIPRALWAQEVAAKLNLPICHQPAVMLGLQQHFDVMAHDNAIYLYPRNVIV